MKKRPKFPLGKSSYDPLDLLKKLDAAGAVLTIAAGKLGYQIPPAASPLLPELHRMRHDVAKILQARLASNLRCWRRAQGVACPIGSSSPAILYREFGRWSGYSCSQEEFIAELAKLGFPLAADGMIAGLILLEDFAAARAYEKERRVQVPALRLVEQLITAKERTTV